MRNKLLYLQQVDQLELLRGSQIIILNKKKTKLHK